MKRNIFPRTGWIILALLFLLYSSHADAQTTQQKPSQIYVPDDIKLYNTIVKLDSILFDAYDKCKLDVSEAMYSDSIEFYHDRGGLMTSKKQLIEALRDNICGKVTRRLVPGSIEVYPIGNWGAIEFGRHGFDNKLEPNAPKSNARFVIIWQRKDDKWIVSRVVSLH